MASDFFKYIGDIQVVMLRITGRQKRCGWSVAEAAPLLSVRVDAIAIRNFYISVHEAQENALH